MTGRRRLLQRALFGLLLLYAFALALPPIWDTDVWWHLRVGQWIAAHHALPHTDILSCLPDKLPWRAMTWLFELGLYSLERAGGLWALRVAAALLVVAGYVVWYRFFRHETGRAEVAIALTALLIVLYDDRIRVRPHLINTIAEGLLGLFCLRGARLRRASERVGFFVAYVLWANLHNPASVLGCALLGFQLLWQYTVAWATSSARPVWRETIWAPALAAVAVVCTPYGVGMLDEARKNVGATAVVDEFQPVLTYLSRGGSVHHVLCGTLPYLALFAVGGVALSLVVRRRLGDPDVRAWLATGGVPAFFLAQSLSSMRFVYLCVAPLAWLLSHPRPRLLSHLLPLPARPWLAWTATSLLLLVSFDYTVVKGHGGPGQYLRDARQSIEHGRFPEIATALAKQSEVASCILTTSAWGGYVHWAGERSQGVAIDARFNVDAEHLALAMGMEVACGSDAGPVVAALDGFHTDLAILPTGCFAFDEVPAPWLALGGDRVGEAVGRGGSVELARIGRRLGLDAVEAAQPERVAAAARSWSQQRFVAAERAHVAELEQRGSHADLHELADIDRIAGRDEAATARLVAHLRAQPSCLRAALELARLLHGRGEYERALRLLAPAAQLNDVPVEVGAWIMHLRSHL